MFAGRSLLQASYNPLANAAWQWDYAYGWTAVSYEQMQDYVSAQTYALRALQPLSGSPADRFGFAWAPKVPTTMTSSEFTTQSGFVLDRLAAAIADSGRALDPADPGLGACAPAGVVSWCTAALDGAWFNHAWNTFTSWSPDALGFVGAATTATAGVVTNPLTVQLQVAGVERAAGTPVSIALSTNSPQGVFSLSAEGPWTSTLDVTVGTGSTGASFYYRDTRSGAATLTASSPDRVAARYTLTVNPGVLASLAVSPGSAGVAAGATQAFSASGADAYGNPVAVAPSWTLTPGTPGTLSTSVGEATMFAASPATGGSGSIVASVGAVTGSAPVVVLAPQLRVSTIAYAVSKKRLVVTFTVTRTSDGRPMPGVTLAFATTRNGTAFASGTAQTGADGRAAYTTAAQATSGCYTTTLSGVSGAGLAWNGVTPANQYCR